MPAAEADLHGAPRLPFPPVTKSQILHCSCHYWHPEFRTVTPKARLIPLSAEFVNYLRADGIVLPPEGNESPEDEEFESEIPVNSTKATSLDGDSDDTDEEEGEAGEGKVNEDATCADPSLKWPEIHSAIGSTISELGGKVIPKLNWSAPKDATWINPTNSMECRTPNDIYLMLKSSDFVTHDLEHAFDGCFEDDEDDDNENYADHNYIADERLGHTNGASVDRDTSESKNETRQERELKDPDIPYTLMLRKAFALNPSVEFRCFVRQRRLLAISQRSVNYFEFLFDLAPKLRSRITEFFNHKIRNSFPDDNFTFDVYIPDPYEKVWLIDFNPWAPRTDPLLFSWLELLTRDGAEERQPFDGDPEASDSREDSEVETISQPEFRLIKRDDPEAYSFNTPQYSAHKLPKDVVEASQAGPGPLREFADQWKGVLNRQQPG